MGAKHESFLELRPLAFWGAVFKETCMFRFLVLTLTTLLTSVQAFAQAAGASPSPLIQMVPLVVVVGIMYFLVLRPQMKKAKDHATFVTQLKRGEEVLTNGGILGRIEGLTDLYVTLEISPNVRIRVLRSAIASGVPNISTSSEVKA
jgi:preprotein translocase subunit YajC